MNGMDLTEFLLARLAEDEQVARAGADCRSHGRGRTVAGSPWIAVGSLLLAIQDDGSHSEIAEVVEYGLDPALDHIARWDPARVLAEVQATRQIIAEHELVPGESAYRGRPAATPSDPRGCNVCMEHDGIVIAGGPCTTLLLLALPYAGHPDYQCEWSATVTT